MDKALSFDPDIRTRARASYLIERERVTINGLHPKASQKLVASDDVWVVWVEEETDQPELKPFPLALDILYEDEDIIVLNKPSGLVVHPSVGHRQDTLVNALLHHTKDLSMKFGQNRPGIVHRLDRDTSGILVVAKNDYSHEELAAQFKAKTNHRVYYAIGLGLPPRRSGVFQSYLARHPTDRKKFSSVRDSQGRILREPGNLTQGKWAVTRFEVLKVNPAGFAYFKLKLETGRTHQIRVHLAEFGSPILTDSIYSSPRSIKKIKSTHFQMALMGFPRLALHAAELGFQHPKTKQNLLFKQNWPQEIMDKIKIFFGEEWP